MPTAPEHNRHASDSGNKGQVESNEQIFHLLEQRSLEELMVRLG